MATKDNYIELTKDFAGSHQQIASAMEGINVAIKSINDNNVLHMQATVKTGDALERVADSLDELKKGYTRYLLATLWLFGIAMVVLAGAEKALSFLANLP